MKRWAVLVVVLYFFILVSLTFPLLVVAFYPTKNPQGMLEIYGEWAYWAGLGLMVAGEAVMLLVPVELAMQRPTTRRSVFWPVLASGLMMGLLSVGAVISVIEYTKSDKAADLADAHLKILVALVVAVWGVWSVVFYQTGRNASAMDVVSRQCRYLLRGSILELLVAVPTHIVARYRNYCCAGFLTFVGIAFGVSVMLFSFGPGVFFLFVQRWKRLHPQQM